MDSESGEVIVSHKLDRREHGLSNRAMEPFASRLVTLTCPMMTQPYRKDGVQGLTRACMLCTCLTKKIHPLEGVAPVLRPQRDRKQIREENAILVWCFPRGMQVLSVRFDSCILCQSKSRKDFVYRLRRSFALTHGQKTHRNVFFRNLNTV